jgi:hypothetical protein
MVIELSPRWEYQQVGDMVVQQIATLIQVPAKNIAYQQWLRLTGTGVIGYAETES